MRYVPIVIHISLFLCLSHGNPLDGFRWKRIVEERIRNVPEKCLQGFLNRYRDDNDKKWTFEELVFDEAGKRKELCAKAWEDESTWPARDGSCDPDTDEYYQVLWNLICYEFNVSDSLVPPVSTECVLKYSHCSGAGRHLTDLLIAKMFQVGEQDNSSKQNESFIQCLSSYPNCLFMPHTLDNFYFLGQPMIHRQIGLKLCNNHFQICYDAIFGGLFREFLDLRKMKEQYYMCGTLTECLVNPSLYTPFEKWNLVCTKTEAEVADHIMCSDTLFTPDVSGEFLLSDEAKDLFYDCFKVTISSLKADIKGRKSLCKSMYTYGRCAESHEFYHLGLSVVFNFLCFDQYNSISYVSYGCRDILNSCLELQDVSYLEMTDYIKNQNKKSKENWCDHLSDLNTCIMDPRQATSCTDREMDYIQSHLCIACTLGPNALYFFSALMTVACREIDFLF